MTQESNVRLRQLRIDAILGKKKHFNAADRKQVYQTRIGVAAIIINVLLSSGLLVLLKSEIADAMKWLGALMSAGAAVLTACQTFFGYPKVVAGHRRVANQYLELAKQISNTLAGFNDKAITDNALLKRLESFTAQISKVNSDASAFSTNDDDYAKAKKGIEDGEEEYTDRDITAGG